VVLIKPRQNQSALLRDEQGQGWLDFPFRTLSTILAGLSIQAANGSTKAELKRTAEMALRSLGY
jgi:hypothetical protein